MPDRLGLVTLPVATAGTAAPTNVVDPIGDKSCRLLGDYLATWINDHAGDAWRRLYPVRGSQPVRTVLVHDPGEFQLSDQALPALFLWRTGGQPADVAFDWRDSGETIRLLWVPPLDEAPKLKLRVPFYAAIPKIVDRAIERGIHPAWWVPVDDDTDRYGEPLAADDDAILLPRATSVAPTSPHADGALGSAPFPLARRALTVTWATTTSATYDTSADVEIDAVDLFGQTTTLVATPPLETGGSVTIPTDVTGPYAIRIPAALATGGSIRVGVAARAGRGRAIRDALRCSDLAARNWKRERLKIDVLAPDNTVERTLIYPAVFCEITIAEFAEADPSVGTDTWDQFPGDTHVGLTIDVTNTSDGAGFHSVAELPQNP